MLSCATTFVLEFRWNGMPMMHPMHESCVGGCNHTLPLSSNQVVRSNGHLVMFYCWRYDSTASSSMCLNLVEHWQHFNGGTDFCCTCCCVAHGEVGLREDFVLHEDGIEWNVSRILGEYLSKAGPLGVTECVVL
jgi:hypothetical protein